jgi:hypothetical protein
MKMTNNLSPLKLLLVTTLALFCPISLADCIGVVNKNTQERNFDGSKKACYSLTNLEGKSEQICPYIYSKGSKLTAISQYWSNPETRSPVYCIHGGGCYLAADIKLTKPCELQKN